MAGRAVWVAIGKSGKGRARGRGRGRGGRLNGRLAAAICSEAEADPDCDEGSGHKEEMRLLLHSTVAVAAAAGELAGTDEQQRRLRQSVSE